MKTYGKINEKRCQRIWDTAYATAFVSFLQQEYWGSFSATREAIKYADSAVDQLLELDTKQ